jgi:hypothetical protein
MGSKIDGPENDPEATTFKILKDPDKLPFGKD